MSLPLWSSVSRGWAFPARDNAVAVPTSFVDLEGGSCVWALQRRSWLHSYPQHSSPLPKALARGRRVGKEPPSSCTPKEAHAELARWGRAVEHLLLPMWGSSSKLLGRACCCGGKARRGVSQGVG